MLLTISTFFTIQFVKNNIREEIKTNIPSSIAFKINYSSPQLITSQYNGYKIKIEGYKVNSELLYLDSTAFLEGKFKLIENSENNLFLLGQNIKYTFETKNVLSIEEGSSIRTNLYKWVDSKNEYYSDFINLLVLGRKNSDSKTIYDNLKNNGVVHLFVISGFHINILYWILKKILNLIIKNNNFLNAMIFILLALYLYLINFNIPALRAITMLFFSKQYLHFKRKKLNSITNLSCVAGLFIVYKPMLIFNLSFIMTFWATFILICINKIHFQNRILKYLSFCILVNIGMLPISIYLNNYWNITSIIQVIIATPIISFVYILSIIMFPFEFLLVYIYAPLLQIINWSSQFNINFEIDILKIWQLISYYVLFFTTIIFFQYFSRIDFIKNKNFYLKNL